MPDSYPRETESAVWVLPVSRSGETVGYVWASVTDDAFGFENRPEVGEALDVATAWVQRNRWGKANGVRPMQLLTRWAGAPEHEKAGFVPKVTPLRAPSLAAVREFARADDPRNPRRYPTTTEAAVRFLPVIQSDSVYGYLWASVTDDAGGFQLPRDRGWTGLTEHSWFQRIQWAKENGLRPLQMLQHWAGEPTTPSYGYLPAVPPLEAPSLDALRRLAEEADPRQVEERYRDPHQRRRR